MSKKWLIIGISGVTCGGKTTIANQLKKIIPGVHIISQDNYFLPVDDERHIWIAELNHINFDILTSLDMDKMYEDVKDMVANSVSTDEVSNQKLQDVSLSPANEQTDILQRCKHMNLNILILEGFCIFNYEPMEKLCNLKYFTTLNERECYNRRIKRVYDPEDCPGYFEQCAWPEYLKQLEYVKSNVKNVHYISEFTEDPIKIITHDLEQALDSMIKSA